MPGHKKHNQVALDIEKQKNLSRLEKMMLRGLTNQTDMAAAFGVTRGTIRTWIQEIEKDWLETDRQDVQLERTIRVKQIESVAVQALNSYERSKQDQEEVVISYADCKQCNGRGKVGLGELREDCKTCNGAGRVTVETTRIKGQAGDAAFLKLAKECFVECARLKGVYPGGNARVGALVKSAQEVGGEAQQTIEEYYIEAPPEMIIQAKAVLEELREKVSQRQVRTIEVAASKPPQEGTPEEPTGGDDAPAGG